jgi:hypothetical protein
VALKIYVDFRQNYLYDFLSLQASHFKAEIRKMYSCAFLKKRALKGTSIPDNLTEIFEGKVHVGYIIISISLKGINSTPHAENALDTNLKDENASLFTDAQ